MEWQGGGEQSGIAVRARASVQTGSDASSLTKPSSPAHLLHRMQRHGLQRRGACEEVVGQVQDVPVSVVHQAPLALHKAAVHGGHVLLLRGGGGLVGLVGEAE